MTDDEIEKLLVSNKFGFKISLVSDDGVWFITREINGEAAPIESIRDVATYLRLWKSHSNHKNRKITSLSSHVGTVNNASATVGIFVNTEYIGAL